MMTKIVNDHDDYSVLFMNTCTMKSFNVISAAHASLPNITSPVLNYPPSQLSYYNCVPAFYVEALGRTQGWTLLDQVFPH